MYICLWKLYFVLQSRNHGRSMKTELYFECNLIKEKTFWRNQNKCKWERRQGFHKKQKVYQGYKTIYCRFGGFILRQSKWNGENKVFSGWSI